MSDLRMFVADRLRQGLGVEDIAVILATARRGYRSRVGPADLARVRAIVADMRRTGELRAIYGQRYAPGVVA